MMASKTNRQALILKYGILIILLNCFLHPVFARNLDGRYSPGDTILRTPSWKISPFATASFSPVMNRYGLGAACYKMTGGAGSYYIGMRTIVADVTLDYFSNSYRPAIQLGYSETFLFLELGANLTCPLVPKPTMDLSPFLGLSFFGYGGVFVSYSLLNERFEVGARFILTRFWKNTKKKATN